MRVIDAQVCDVEFMNGFDTEVDGIRVLKDEIMKKLERDLAALIIGPRAACQKLIIVSVSEFTAVSRRAFCSS